MVINGAGMRQSYKIIIKTLCQPDEKVKQIKKLTEDIVGGSINKQIDYQQKMINITAQVNIGINILIQQKNMINFFG